MLEKWARDLLRSNSGTTAVELAFVLPILLIFLMGVVEYNVIMFAQATLEGAVTSGAREGKTGYTASGESQQAYIYGIVQGRTSGILNPNQLTISSKSYANFSNIGQPEPCIVPYTPPCGQTAGVTYVDVNHNGQWDSDQGTAGLGGSGDIVVYTVTYPWNILTPVMKTFLGTGGVFTLTSSAVVKNEPYSSSR